MNERNLELKVGIFVFVGLVILVGFILLIGDFQDFHNRYNIKIIFSFINGIKIGAPVRFSGLDAGEVKDLRPQVDPLTNQTKIEAIARIKGEIKIPHDSKVWVNTLGLLGEKYLEIMPGRDYHHILKNGDVLIGSDPVPMNEFSELAFSIVQDFKEIINKLNNAQGTIAKLLYEDTLYKDLEAFVADLKAHPWKLLYRPKEETKPKKAPASNIKAANP